MSESLLSAVTVVLYESQDPINIGAVVRAMKNMGVRDLRLVRPCHYDLNRIEQVAHDTRDIVERIRHFDDIDQALSDCVHVIAYSGRRRAARWPRHTPQSAAKALLDWAQQDQTHGEGEQRFVVEGSKSNRVALVFGREDHGVPNDVLDRAHAIATIPTTEHFSLNVAQACLVALYELHILAGDSTRKLAGPKRAAPPPTSQDYEQTFSDVEAALEAIAFFKTRNAEHVMRTIRSIVYRATVDHRELMLIRASSIEVLRTIDRETKRSVAEAIASKENST